MNPYFINEPAAISFSGGRTSAYMLYKILETHDGKLPDFVKVTFANTGKEMPQTLDFVKRCGDEWGVDIVWLELGEYVQDGVYKKGAHKGKPRFRSETKIVTYETASRKGEPFARLVRKRRFAPNPVMRFCTSELKVKRIRDYLRAQGYKDWVQYIGIRADEMRRVAKMHGRKDEGHEMYLPLYLDGVTKETIFDFWTNHPFDLELPNNNGVTDWGNCDLCFLKGYNKRLSIIRERPDLADWWIELELELSNLVGQNAYFRYNTPSYAEMKKISLDQYNIFSDFNDESIPCFCGD